jgi:hypothetical protein
LGAIQRDCLDHSTQGAHCSDHQSASGCGGKVCGVRFSRGENADMCAFVFPGPYHSGSASDPQPPDMKFDRVPYLIQENWVNANGGYCAIRWDE